jgi:hypothetical protein
MRKEIEIGAISSIIGGVVTALILYWLGAFQARLAQPDYVRIVDELLRDPAFLELVPSSADVVNQLIEDAEAIAQIRGDQSNYLKVGDNISLASNGLGFLAYQNSSRTEIEVYLSAREDLWTVQK